MRFDFELLDLFIGQWLATFIPHTYVHFLRGEFCCIPGDAPEGVRMYRAARLSGTRADGALRSAIRASVASGSTLRCRFLRLHQRAREAAGEVDAPGPEKSVEAQRS